MTLSSGHRLGPYEILAPLGEGGMGVVYRAHDTVLGRAVAVKVLPETLSGDATFLARFEREARTLASLNHPNIATIFGMEREGDIRAIVMELVEGPTLEERLRTGAMQWEEAMPVALQLTEALEAAHEKGIAHRDLKPANIKVTADGTVKVLDFGLAKALTADEPSTDPGSSPTLVAGSTRVGMILGTAPYMSPEQARGIFIDKRTDIWAFGVVLYEMLTGQTLFPGELISDILADVLRKEIRFDALPEATPPHVRALLVRCLERDRKNRLRDIGEARILIQNPPAAPVPQPVVATSVQRPLLPWAIAAGLALMAGGASWMAWRGTQTGDHPLIRLNAELASGVELADPTNVRHLAMAPDGKRLAVMIRGKDGVSRMATRRIDQSQVVILSGTDNASNLFFSPDSQWIGFSADGKLKKISVQGGSPVTLCDALLVRGASWGDDGNIIAALGSSVPLSRIPSTGGTPVTITKLNPGERTHRQPYVLPGSRAVLFIADSGTADYDNANIDALSLPGGHRKTVVRGGHSPSFLPSGHLLYAHAGTLFVAPFDEKRLELTGVAVPAMEDAGGVANNNADYGFSSDGTFVYLSGRRVSASRPVSWLDNSGAPSTLHPEGMVYQAPRFSPDGRRLAVGVTSTASASIDIWVKDLVQGTFSRLSMVGGFNVAAVWTRDGKHIFFLSREGPAPGLYCIRSDGSAEARRLLENTQLSPQDITPDGKRLIVINARIRGESAGILSLPLEWDGDQVKVGKPEEFLPNGTQPRLSPDGRWLAYGSRETGSFDVYVRPFPGPGGKWMVTPAHGHRPEWSKNGRELFFLDSERRLNVLEYTVSGATFQAGKSRVWAEARLANMGVGVYDVAPDGKRVAAILSGREDEGEKQTHLMFLLNFFDELRRLAPVKR
ncbi:MAG: serine/threonine-protein kinase [Acidobacteria bacterium]|nr:serine/threonine-protein kinase [Acidobacteriota bacterium]